MHVAIRTVTLATGLLALGACGFTGNFRMNPGYADLRSPGMLDTDRDFALSLGPLPLRIARAFVHDDPELSGMLRALKGVRVYIYDVDGDVERVYGRIEAARGRLVAEGWHPVVAVREDGGVASALVRLDQEPNVMRGLVVMFQDEEEVVFVNLIGSIEPETFALAMSELGIDVPMMALATH